MARSKRNTGSALGPSWTENVTWPLLCPYKVPVTLLPREEDFPVISRLETPEEEGDSGRLTRLMMAREKKESFTLTFTVFLEEEVTLWKGTRKSSCSGMGGIKEEEEEEEEERERACNLRAGEVSGLIFLVLQLKLL